MPRAPAGPLPVPRRAFAGTLTNSFVKQRNSFVKHGILLLNDFLNFKTFLNILNEILLLKLEAEILLLNNEILLLKVCSLPRR